MNKMSGETVDLTSNNIEKLKKLFPEIISEGDKIDFDKLKTIMGNAVDDQKERYNFTWHGKKESILGAQKPSKGTLRPDKEKSKNFDTTENLYIEGDNLETLKLLQKSYNNKVKVIYIDPPYNTGNDFIYKDNFKEGIDNYLEQTGQVDSEGNKLSTNSESQGRYHSNWLNMMYPRLRLAKNLLTDDGVIFVSIDHNESFHLRLLLNQVFSETNFITDISWRRSDNQSNIGRDAKVKDSILVFAKNKDKLEFGRLPLSEKAISEYGYQDAKGKYGRGQIRDEVRGRHNYSIETPNGNIIDGPWMISKNDFNKMVKEDRIHWPKGGGIPRSKIYLSDKLLDGQITNDIWIGPEYGTNQRGNEEIKELFGYRAFDFLKPRKLMQNIINLGSTKSDDIILDFFSGSSSLADATLHVNKNLGTNKKFIMVQLPEPLDEKSEAYKRGYRTICDIGEERIRRAGEKVKHDLIEKNKKDSLLSDNLVDPDDLDIGFKVFKLDKSNIKEWNIDFENISQLELYENIFVEGRSELDIVYEILLKNGIELTYPINTFEIDKKQIYDVAYGNLFICLSDTIDTSVAKAIVKKRKEYNIETSSVVFKDAGFGGNDSEKLNVIEILKDAGYTDEQLLTI